MWDLDNTPLEVSVGTPARQNDLFWTIPASQTVIVADIQIGGSGSPRLLRSLIPGTSIRFVRVRSYDRPGRSIVTVLLETSM